VFMIGGSVRLVIVVKAFAFFPLNRLGQAFSRTTPKNSQGHSDVLPQKHDSSG
jgi:hypothetical protein